MPSLAQEPPAELLEKKRDRRVPKAPFPPATTTFPLRGAGWRPGGYGSTTGDIRPEKKTKFTGRAPATKLPVHHLLKHAPGAFQRWRSP